MLYRLAYMEFVSNEIICTPVKELCPIVLITSDSLLSTPCSSLLTPPWPQLYADDMVAMSMFLVWRDNLVVSAINCAKDGNLAICRDHGVEQYPTLKVSWS